MIAIVEVEGGSIAPHRSAISAELEPTEQAHQAKEGTNGDPSVPLAPIAFTAVHGVELVGKKGCRIRFNLLEPLDYELRQDSYDNA